MPYALFHADGHKPVHTLAEFDDQPTAPTPDAQLVRTMGDDEGKALSASGKKLTGYCTICQVRKRKAARGVWA